MSVTLEKKVRQPIIVVLGHVDSGKCVSGDTLIQLADGRIMEARSVFEMFKKGYPAKAKDGVFYRAEGLELLSLDEEGKIAPKKVSHVWKLKTDRLVKIETHAGYTIKTTPEHRFLVKRGESVQYVEAEKLRTTDSLLLPVKINVKKDIKKFKEFLLKRLSEDFVLRIAKSYFYDISSSDTLFSDPIFGNELKEKLGNYKREICLPAKSYADFLSRLKIDYAAGYDAIAGISLRNDSITHGRRLWISLPKNDKELAALAYASGLLFAIGIESNFKEIYRDDLSSSFARAISKAFKLGKWLKFADGYYSSQYIESLAILLKRLLGYNEDYHEDQNSSRMLETILMMPDELLTHFVRGIFDAKGCVEDGKVMIDCNGIAKFLPIILQRLGCMAYIKDEDGGHKVLIGSNFAFKFFRLIGLCSKDILAKVSLANDHIFEYPISFSSIKAELNSDFISNFGGFDLRLRPNQGSASLQNLLYEKSLIGENIMENLCSVNVKRIEIINGDFEVYDFTVDETHNFIGNCIILHNTSLLDKMRGTAVQEREAGGITQQIGASYFPPEVLVKICGELIKMFGGNIKVPGLLVIDTPGHEAFANLRLRGGSAADIAILVVDATKGLEAQSFESIEILKSRKVPFVVALNKIDLLAGWIPDQKRLVKDAGKYLDKAVINILDEAIYRVVGQLAQVGFASEAYYRVRDFTREVAIVPVSARTGEGIAELLAVLVGLSQQYLAKRLQLTGKQVRGIILEVEETTGLGPTANIILIDGKLKTGSTILVAKRNSVEAVKIRAILLPKPLDEMRDPRDKFETVEEVNAAAGVKIAAPGLEGVLAGSPVIGVSEEDDVEELKKSIIAEVKSAMFETDQDGVILKANTLGSLEALTNIVKRYNIPVRIADIGNVSKSDVIQASSVAAKDRYLGVILAFNVKVLEDAREESEKRGVRIFSDPVIYSLIESYLNWQREEKEKETRMVLASITPPCKFSVLKGLVFRRSNPAIFGVEILEGRLRQKVKVMNSYGEEVGQIQQIQSEGQEITEAYEGSKVAVSMKEPTIGRQIKEGEILYSLPDSDEARTLLQKFSDRLSEKERALLNEIIQIRRKVQNLYAF